MNNPLATLFEQFLKERTYLNNVTPRTIHWYQTAFNVGVVAVKRHGTPSLENPGTLAKICEEV
jgi:hypothetical protein